MTLALAEWGDAGAPRVVCLHGVTGHGRHFAKLADALPGFHVLAPDLLGHGSSSYEPPWDLEPTSAAIVETVGAEPASLVGHSFGGRLAFELAARAPKLVPRLVLLDPAIHVLPHVALFAAENARRERAYVSFDEGDRPPLRGEPARTRAPRELVAEELRSHLVPGDDGRYRYRYCQAAVVAAYGEMASAPPPFERARVPTLLVLGERSYLPYDHLLEAHRAALGDLLEVVVVPGGHTVLWDALDETRRRGRATSSCGLSPAYVLVGDGERLVEDRDALVHLLAGDRQRRHDHDHVPVRHQVEATLERRLRHPRHRRRRLARRVERDEHLARLAVLHELDAPEAAEPAHVADRRVPLRERAQRARRDTRPSSAAFSTTPSSWNASIDATAEAQASGWPAYVSPPGKNLPRTQSASGSRMIIAPSGTYPELIPFATVMMSGHDVPVLAREPAPGAAEAGHDLVEDQQDAVPVADLADRLEIAVGRRDDPVRPRHRLEDHRGDRVRRPRTRGSPRGAARPCRPGTGPDGPAGQRYVYGSSIRTTPGHARLCRPSGADRR